VGNWLAYWVTSALRWSHSLHHRIVLVTIWLTDEDCNASITVTMLLLLLLLGDSWRHGAGRSVQIFRLSLPVLPLSAVTYLRNMKKSSRKHVTASQRRRRTISWSRQDSTFETRTSSATPRTVRVLWSRRFKHRGALRTSEDALLRPCCDVIDQWNGLPWRCRHGDADSWQRVIVASSSSVTFQPISVPLQWHTHAVALPIYYT